MTQKIYALALHSIDPLENAVRTEFLPVEKCLQQLPLLDSSQTVRAFDLWLRQRETRDALGLCANPVCAVQLVSYEKDAAGTDDPRTLMDLTPPLYMDAMRVDAEDRLKTKPVYALPAVLRPDGICDPEDNILIRTADGDYYTHYKTDIVINRDTPDYTPEKKSRPISERLKDCQKHDAYQENSWDFVGNAIEFLRAGIASLFKSAARPG